MPNYYNTETSDLIVLTEAEVAALNTARTICFEYERRVTTAHSRSDLPTTVDAYNCGRVAVEAEAAKTAIFSLLSAAHIYMDFPLTHAQLHEHERWSPSINAEAVSPDSSRV